MVKGLEPPANNPRIEFEPLPIPCIVNVKSPNLVELPFDAIVINCISDFLTVQGVNPPAKTPLVGEAHPELFLLATLVSPKSTAFPNVAIST